MFDKTLGRARRRLTTIAAAVAVVIALPIAVIAAHSFDDVPDSNQFHDAIGWMQENGITVGCNPPANTQYCPEDNVSRQQMAAFMFRLAQTQGSAGVGVTDPADTVTVSGTTYGELLTLDAAPTSEATVTLNAHVTLSKPAATAGSYQVIVARDSCTGTVVGAGGWSSGIEAESSTVAVTATDVATSTTTYVLCAAETVDTSPDATASLRGLTAAWDATA